MYGGIIHPFSLTVGAADKTQRDVEINQLAFFFLAFSGLWPCHTGNIRKDVILTIKYVSLMCLGRRKLRRRKGETRDGDPPSLQTLRKPQRN